MTQVTTASILITNPEKNGNGIEPITSWNNQHPLHILVNVSDEAFASGTDLYYKITKHDDWQKINIQRVATNYYAITWNPSEKLWGEIILFGLLNSDKTIVIETTIAVAEKNDS